MKTLIALAALLAAAPLVPASAQSVASRTVATADLDLATAPGRAALDRRIHHAAEDLCGPVSDLNLSGQNAVRRCRAATVAAAAAQAHSLVAGTPVRVAASR